MEHLITIENLVEALELQFLPLEPMLTGFRLIGPGLLKEDIQYLEIKLGTVLPESFVTVILKYNLGAFTLGPTVFGNDCNYKDKLLSSNSTEVNSWWGSGKRQLSMLMIGNSDPFAILIDCDNGNVLVFKHGEAIEDRIRVATDFSLYLRGLGTVFIERQRSNYSSKLGENVAALVGSSHEGYSYWAELAY